MRCIACAGEMQLIRSEPDQSMLLSGQQLCSFKCPNCHHIEQTLVFTRNMETDNERTDAAAAAIPAIAGG
jgi:hypothetical protein